MSGGAATEVSFRTVPVWGGKIEMRVQVKGQGDPILYLHPAGGMAWDRFLDDLATDHTVFAPEFPGMTPGASDAINHLDDIFDVVLAYDDALRGLGLSDLPVIGQSFGGMLAAELAASFPERFSRVVLLDPAGLWMTSHPYALDPLSSPPERVPGMLFHDPTCAGAQAMFTPPADPETALDRTVALVWAIGCSAKFLWPIPDRGLHKRLHRVTAPTLVMWGKQDALVPVAYAHEFGRRIAGAEVVVVDQCGHIPQVEQPEVTIRTVRRFVG